VQQLESSRLKLVQLEQELGRVRQQVWGRWVIILLNTTLWFWHNLELQWNGSVTVTVILLNSMSIQTCIKRLWNISGRVETWCKQPEIGWRGSKVHIIVVKIIPTMCLILPVSLFGCKSCLAMYINFSCVRQINRTSRGDVTPEELKERQVCHIVPKSLHSDIII